LTQVIKRAAYYNENRGSKYADKVITLTLEDSTRLHELYGRSADKIIPITVSCNTKFANILQLESPYILFCGSYFGPNINGIKWFIDTVLPHIKFTLIVIGFQMENLTNLKSQIRNFDSSKIKIIGTVDSVTPYYQQAVFVINPIQQGAGMNTKSVEAMAYGKVLITTEFAIKGFPNPLPKTILVCKTAENFIQTLNLKFDQLQNIADSFNEESFAYYQTNFTLEKRIQQIKEML
jgi:hypothetical protein